MPRRTSGSETRPPLWDPVSRRQSLSLLRADPIDERVRESARGLYGSGVGVESVSKQKNLARTGRGWQGVGITRDAACRDRRVQHPTIARLRHRPLVWRYAAYAAVRCGGRSHRARHPPRRRRAGRTVGGRGVGEARRAGARGAAKVFALHGHPGRTAQAAAFYRLSAPIGGSHQGAPRWRPPVLFAHRPMARYPMARDVARRSGGVGEEGFLRCGGRCPRVRDPGPPSPGAWAFGAGARRPQPQVGIGP